MKITNKSLNRYLLVWVAILALPACSTAPVQTGEELIAPEFPADRVLREDVTYLDKEISDPLEGFNRTMYRFNYGFDRYVFLPAVNAYQTVLPNFMQTGINNFFRNIFQITTLINSILQLSPRKSVNTTGRFIVNSTVGILGLFDVASALNMPHHEEDFGQTLGYWGVGNGPYLVIPILGPSNARDGFGFFVDWFTRLTIRQWLLETKAWQEWLLTFTNAIDLRSRIAFRYYETGSPFEYEWVRLLYTTKRELEIEK